MNFKQLSHFVALIEHRSFMRAAEACNLSQPAFSRSIRSLEENLGCLLVDRYSGRNLSPTLRGEQVLQHAHSVLESVAQLTNTLSRNTELDLGQVRIGCGPVPAVDLVPKAVAIFMSQYPGMQVRLDIESWRKLSRSLQREELDFIVAASRAFKDDSSYDVHPLRPQRLAVFCRRGHPLHKLPSVSAQQLFSYPIGLSNSGKENVFQLAYRNGVRTPRIGLECDNIHSLLSVVGNTDIVGILHAESYRFAFSGEGIVRLDSITANLDELYARYGIITRKNQRLPAGAQRLMLLIQKQDGNPAEPMHLSI